MKRKALIIIALLIFAYFLAAYLILSNSIGETVNINTCTQESLESLPYIGEVLAVRIIENRPYYSIEELNNIKGIGEVTYFNIIRKVVVK